MTVNDRFAALGIDNAPGQQAPVQKTGERVMDFSHGDVDAFPPASGAIEAVNEAYLAGSGRAYSPYRGHGDLLNEVADKLAGFTGAPVDPANGLMITPGTQGGLFLALSAIVEPGDKVAIVEPDYFANRKIIAFLGGRIVPVALDYEDVSAPATVDVERIEDAARSGTKLLVFSNPNNPTGVVYTQDQIRAIVSIAQMHGMFVVVDQLYSRLIYPGQSFTHLRASGIDPANCLTLMGPSKTESLSGFRTGVAMGPAPILDRMEQILAIHSLRTAGYNQAVLTTWFNEPEGWLEQRVEEHQDLRNDLVSLFRSVDGVAVRPTEGGSYLFPKLPEMGIPAGAFCESLRLEDSIVVTPGAEFSPHHAASIRLNFSQDRHRAVAAVESIVQRIEERTR
ncbi:pyridoxal phosphate-dependent aminotransferase [Prauserella muralis]|uniref:Aspartate aminotransferase n=1 Tax=Prauserella muralis TaxID=588067 RepID=A0A2V4AM01_9PSEU|nr:pyridoxal phosphate-dependent aminotransferase [Prauserella muralis]PXY21328.1 aspartate aminotransferase [Prauserella muralis]TWE30454.1 aspartate/methionine/tyrosine aminotransferase [Prauserella muralis]